MAAAAVTALALVGLGIAGCGGGGGGDATYGEVLRGLKDAAASNQSYDAVGHAEGLEATEEASINAFCETAKQILQNHESVKLSETPYITARIQTGAEEGLDFVSTGTIHAEVKKLAALYDLASFDADSLRRYARACYR